jgi:ATP-dependent helicase/nuclease subunit A
MTIHKAKGLEFPVVILPGFHHGTSRGREGPPVSHDWSSGVLGIALGERCSLGAVLVGEKLRLREEAERRRLFYVGMTRAKERLILSGGLSARAGKGAFLGLLQEAVSDEIGQAGQAVLRVGPVSFGQTVVATSDRAPRRRRGAPEKLHASTEWKSLAPLWERRDRAWDAAREMSTHLTPTRLAAGHDVRSSRAGLGGDASERARLIGILAHRVLQHWDFAEAPGKLTERIAAACRREVPSGWTGNMTEVEGELHRMLLAFAGAAPFRDLRRAEILGREVPFAMPWPVSSAQHSALNAQHCLMEGVIDVIYRLDGRIHLADYKTDRVEDSELADRAAAYEGQVRVYREAVARCLGVKQVGVQLIFLRNGKAVSV